MPNDSSMAATGNDATSRRRPPSRNTPSLGGMGDIQYCGLCQSRQRHYAGGREPRFGEARSQCLIVAAGEIDRWSAEHRPPCDGHTSIRGAAVEAIDCHRHSQGLRTSSAGQLPVHQRRPALGTMQHPTSVSSHDSKPSPSTFTNAACRVAQQGSPPRRDRLALGKSASAPVPIGRFVARQSLHNSGPRFQRSVTAVSITPASLHRQLTGGMISLAGRQFRIPALGFEVVHAGKFRRHRRISRLIWIPSRSRIELHERLLAV